MTTPLYIALPASTVSDGLLRAPLSAIFERWPESHHAVARSAIERHAPSGLVHFNGEPQLTKWHTRWLANWTASVMRTDAAELIELADAGGGAR